MDSLRAEARVRLGLSGVAHMKVDGRDGALRADYVLFLERPARLRVEILGLLNQTLAVLVTEGGRYQFFQVEDRRYESGPVYPGLLREVAGVPLTPGQAVDLLLGAPLPEAELGLTGSARQSDGAVVAIYTGPKGRSQRFEFDPRGQLRRVETRSQAGSLVWEARFGDYEPVGERSFAHEIRLAFPRADTRARLRLRGVQLNPELAPEAFVLKVPGS
jgi:hypothetical protein